MRHILFVLLILSAAAYAQEDRLSLRAHFGYSVSQFSLDTRIEDFRSTINTGFEIRRQLGQTGIYIQSGIRWNGYGWKHTATYGNWNGKGYDTTFTSRTNVSFFTLPYILSYKFKKVVPGFILSAGPQVSFFSFYKHRDDDVFSHWDLSGVYMSAFFSVGYEHKIGERWMLGEEVYANFLAGELYNFGIGISGRYILKQKGSHRVDN